MKQTLPDYIKQNEDLRKILLAQKGGIMKYWAEHLDANGTAELFHAYQDHCVDIFFEKNKWDLRAVWEGENMRRAALGEAEHLWKELRYQRAVKAQLAGVPSEIVEKIDDFTELYLTYTYKQNRQRRYPGGMTPTDIYQEVIGLYNTLGLAYKSMEIVLNEHHAKGEHEKSESELLTEFCIRQWSVQFTLGALWQMRQAVAEMLDGKTDAQCRQMAIDTMLRVRGFSQRIYTEEVVRSLRPKYKEDAEQREKDGEWLRDVASHTVFEEFNTKVKIHSMRWYFADFVNLLKDVGRIWAAQLLVHGIDMKKLEEEVCCILKPAGEPFYYVDRFYSDDTPGHYCISNSEMANKLLKAIHGEDDGEEEINDGIDNTDDIDDSGEIEDSAEFADTDETDDSDDSSDIEKQHSKKYYGKDYEIFHDNLNVNSIVAALMTLPRGEVRSNRKFFLTVHTAFDTLHWLTCNTATKFISWMKYHSGIHFETNDFKNLSFDENMKLLLPEIIAVFSEEVDDDCYDDKEEFYKKDSLGNCLTKINKGYD